MERKELRALIKEFGRSEAGEGLLHLLFHRYPVPNSWEVQTWEQQRLLSGQQQVLADLTKLLREGDI